MPIKPVHIIELFIYVGSVAKTNMIQKFVTTAMVSLLD